MTQTLAISAVAIVLLAAGWGIDHFRLSAARDAAQAERDALTSQVALQRAQFEAVARQREREQREAIEAIRKSHQTEMQRASEKHAAVVAGLRSDSLRLRQHWHGDCPAPKLSPAVAATFRTDDATRLREQGAADIVRAAAECDAQVRALQGVIEADRRGYP